MCIKNPYQIKWRKSKQLLDGYIEQYNSTKPLGEQLRANHKALSQHLLFLYSVAISREQAYGGGVQASSPLPPLRTNNKQLADALGCSERTIINLRARLKAAKVILKETFKGTNAQYEVVLSGAVIHLQTVREPKNVIHLFQQGVNAAAGAPPSPPLAKTLRHTVSSNTDQVTKELIELSGVDFQQRADFQANEQESAVSKGVESCGKSENVVENQQMGSIQGTQGTLTGNEPIRNQAGTPPPLRPTPPETKVHAAPKTVAEALAGLSDAIANKIQRHIQVIWTCALLNLYDDKWIAEEEEERAKAVLAEYFIYASPERFQAGASEIIERIMLVKGWIERGKMKDENRWVPLPSPYFDYRNPKGFTRTKAWYKAHMSAKIDMKNKELVSKAIKEYLKAQEPGATIGPSETYRRISQRLNKRDSSLLNRFHEQISNVNGPDHAKAT